MEILMKRKWKWWPEPEEAEPITESRIQEKEQDSFGFLSEFSFLSDSPTLGNVSDSP